MKNRSLLLLFIINFVIFLTGMGLLPLLPLYAATQFGATATEVGLYLAITYGAITAGSMLTGRLTSRLGHRNVFIGAGVLGVPALVILGQAATFWQVIVLTGIIWFAGGIGIALVNVYTGLAADQKKRGKAFSLTFLAMPLASLTSGITIGPLVEWQGYPTMFTTLALAWAVWPIIGLVRLNHIPTPKGHKKNDSNKRGGHVLGNPFYFLLMATLLSATTVYLTRLGTSLSMHSLNFSATAVASTAAVGGLVTIPVTFAIGSLSDRLGRKRFLALGYILGGIGALILGSAGQLWQIWLATSLLYAALSANGAVAPALATDLLSAETRDRGLPYLNSMRNLAGIIGFAFGGILIDLVGTAGLYAVAAVLSLAATLLLSQMQHRSRQEPVSERSHVLLLSADRSSHS